MRFLRIGVFYVLYFDFYFRGMRKAAKDKTGSNLNLFTGTDTGTIADEASFRSKKVINQVRGELYDFFIYMRSQTYLPERN